MSIGDNIKKFRKIKNLTQQELADVTKISLSAIIKYENNQREAKTKMLAKIANALDIPISDFFKDDEGNYDQNKVEELKSELDERDRMSLFFSPSVAEDMYFKSKVGKELYKFLSSPLLEEKYNYKFNELNEYEMRELGNFVLDMIEFKINQFKKAENQKLI